MSKQFDWVATVAVPTTGLFPSRSSRADGKMPQGFSADGSCSLSADDLIQTCDGSVRKTLRTIVSAKCDGRMFVEIASRDAEQCAQLLDSFEHIAHVQPVFAEMHWYNYYSELLRELARIQAE